MKYAKINHDGGYKEAYFCRMIWRRTAWACSCTACRSVGRYTDRLHRRTTGIPPGTRTVCMCPHRMGACPRQHSLCRSLEYNKRS